MNTRILVVTNQNLIKQKITCNWGISLNFLVLDTVIYLIWSANLGVGDRKLNSREI